MNQAFDVALYDAVQRWAQQIRATSGWTSRHPRNRREAPRRAPANS
jgi:hypothetical protein